MKKFTKTLCMILVGALVFTQFMACSNEPQKEEETTTTTSERELTDETIVRETGASINQVEFEDVVSCEKAIERFEEQLSDYEYFEDVTGEEAEDIIFFFDSEVTDIQYCGVEVDILDSGEFAPTVITNLYTTDELGPDKPFVVSTDISVDIPNRGLVYTDHNGNCRFVLLYENSEDGSIAMYEMHPAG